MDIDFSTLNASQAYFAMTQTIVPRPIAWVLSQNANGSYNLAPFSYFSALCSDPPLIGISIGKKTDGSLKDTRTNILERRYFVIHIAHAEQVECVNASAETLPADISEVETLGLATTPLVNFPLPRLSDCRIAIGCELHSGMQLSDTFTFMLGLVRQLYIADSIVQDDGNGRFKLDTKALNPLSRLGAGEYASFGEVIQLKSPL